MSGAGPEATFGSGMLNFAFDALALQTQGALQESPTTNGKVIKTPIYKVRSKSPLLPMARSSRPQSTEMNNRVDPAPAPRHQRPSELHDIEAPGSISVQHLTQPPGAAGTVLVFHPIKNQIRVLNEAATGNEAFW